MSNKHFRFKQFLVKQERAAMKVGTDGVLLGAWVNPEGAEHILDVGTGTGLLSLMMAQRCNARIDAVEIEEGAFSEAKINIENSPWSDRISVYHTDFNDFALKNSRKYDMVVCNPPFFENSLNAPDKSRSSARHNISLTYSQLLKNSFQVLKPGGELNVIIPVDSYNNFCKDASAEGFYPRKCLFIKTSVNKPAKRVLLQLALTPGEVTEEEISIMDENGEYSVEYRELTNKYYLYF